MAVISFNCNLTFYLFSSRSRSRGDRYVPLFNIINFAINFKGPQLFILFTGWQTATCVDILVIALNWLRIKASLIKFSLCKSYPLVLHGSYYTLLYIEKSRCPSIKLFNVHKRISFLMYEQILIRMYTFKVYHLRNCMKEDNPG